MRKVILALIAVVIIGVFVYEWAEMRRDVEMLQRATERMREITERDFGKR